MYCSSNFQTGPETEVNDTLENNIFVSRTATQFIARFSSKFDDIRTFFNVADNNYYARPIDDNISFEVSINHGAKFFHYSFAQWKSYISSKDTHSHKSPVVIRDVNDLRFEYNPTSLSHTIALPFNYIDVKNVSYNGSITLAPYTSAILIKGVQ